ncbi:hypothetical protein HYT23_02975 [Candidatus Pacearchaeota archaeon]|nr:hypothetical protein [Candidatus Pacearchaeota archaeon]
MFEDNKKFTPWERVLRAIYSVPPALWRYDSLSDFYKGFSKLTNHTKEQIISSIVFLEKHELIKIKKSPHRGWIDLKLTKKGFDVALQNELHYRRDKSDRNLVDGTTVIAISAGVSILLNLFVMLINTGFEVFWLKKISLFILGLSVFLLSIFLFDKLFYLLGFRKTLKK